MLCLENHIAHGRFKDFPLEIEITNSPSNDLKARCMELPFLLQNNKGIYDGRWQCVL
jgi:hypothetical protein